MSVYRIVEVVFFIESIPVPHTRSQCVAIQPVIILICMMLLLWSMVSYLELQRSMRWWFEQRTAHLEVQSERIHNGVMQELFVLRRDLEAALEPGQTIATDPNQTDQAKLWAIEKIHHQLEQISDELSPPYIADSLPLAIQSHLQNWQRLHAADLEIELPTTWEQEATAQNQIILMVLNELLQIVMPISPVKLPCCVRLLAQNKTNSVECPKPFGELLVKVTYPNAAMISSILHTKELRYLRRVMRELARGHLFHRRRELTVTWYCHWRLRSAPSLTVGLD